MKKDCKELSDRKRLKLSSLVITCQGKLVDTKPSTLDGVWKWINDCSLPELLLLMGIVVMVILIACIGAGSPSGVPAF